ncbi:shikimate dehydrogenase [Candidatus Peregrinibacteria bacterium]|nr:shikimate dehydrogenase [Candidatus Peregrinibacteria bacterium]
MKHYGILAFPTGHSRSPEMQNAAFQHLKIDAVFERYEIPPEKLAEFFQENFRKERKIEGLAVSIPHKESILPFLGLIDEAAKKIGAVNTVFWNDGKICGTNTDWVGFSKSLKEEYDVRGKRVLILGAGGVARAIIYALIKSKAEKVVIANRTEEKAKKLAEEFGVEWKTISDCDPDEFDLIVNATPIGMRGKFEGISPLSNYFWKAHHTAFDVVYTPEETQFLKDAKKSGAQTISGKKMFLFQGMAQFKIWTGENAPESIMIQALQNISEGDLK